MYRPGPSARVSVLSMYGDGGGVRAAVARVAGGGGGGKGAYYRAGVLGRGERSEAFWLLMCIIDRQVIVSAIAPWFNAPG